jgi:hypothetical protein
MFLYSKLFDILHMRTIKGRTIVNTLIAENIAAEDLIAKQKEFQNSQKK